MNQIDRPRLPVFAICLQAFRIFCGNLSTYVRLAWFPFVVVAATAPFFDEAVSLIEDSSNPMEQSVGSVAVIAAVVVIQCMAVSPMATAWHRLIIIGSSSPESDVRYIVRRPEWAYLRRMVAMIVVWLMVVSLIVALTVIVIAGVSLVAQPTAIDIMDELSERTILSEIFFQIVGIVASLPVVIYLVALPAVAVGNAISYREVWRLLKGNACRTWVALVLAGLPITIFSAAVHILELTTGPKVISGLGSIHTLAVFVGWFFWAAVPLGAMSLAYRFLVEGKPIAAAGAAEPAP